MGKRETIISIITPSYNQGEFIEETIQSVLKQDGDFYIDYIIMDGGSKDQSVNIIKKYENLLKEKCKSEIINGISYYISNDKEFYFNKCNGISYRWVSEKDGGQAEAINKGIEKSLGSIIGWLNSDDVYYAGALKLISAQDLKKYDLFYGEGMWISKIGKILLAYPTFEPSIYSFFYQCTLCQPAVFFTRKVFVELGQLNNKYYCGFDFEYWMRALFQGRRFFHIDYYLAKSRMYQENKSLANQRTVKRDINAFKNKYYKNIKLDPNRTKEFEYIHKEAASRVQKLALRLETGEKINLIFDATIIINDSEKTDGRSGIFFVGFNILKQLLKREEVNITLFCYKNRLPELERVLDDKLSDIKFVIITEDDFNNGRLDNVDIYFSPLFKIPAEVKQRKDIIKYTILYDVIMMIFPEFFPVKQHWLTEMIDEINSEDHYFVISKNTKRDFIKYVPKINPNNIAVTYLAAADNFFCNKDGKIKEIVFKKYNIAIPKKYIFSLCTLEPRKNLMMTIKGFIKFIDKNKINDLILILGGGHRIEFIKKLENEIDSLDKYKDKIIRTGYIDDEDLSIFYSFSEFFVYPSLYEGFGLPVLEAMKCGVPVITSNNSSLPEVVGDAGITVNPKSEKELVDAFEKLYFNDNLRAELSKKGLEMAGMFSWERTVDLMIKDIIKSLKNHQLPTVDKTEDRKGNEESYLKKVFNKSRDVILNSSLRKPLRKIYYAIKFKKI